MKLINKIKKSDFSKKTDLFIAADLSTYDANQMVMDMVLSLPKGHYKLHDRTYGTNLVDAVYGMYGWMPAMFVSESMMLGLQAVKPERVYASFTLGLDVIEIK